MPSNAEAAEAFRAIADLLDVLGERFKPEAYRRAARSLDALTEELAAIGARHELRSIPGVGEAIEEKLEEFLATGRIAYLERLRREVPPGVAEILRLPGLGPKTARRFWTDLGIEGPAELASALDAGRLDGVKGFGPKKIAQIRAALAAAGGPPSARRPIEAAYPVALRLVRALREEARADRVEIAGSFRRGRETVGDLDLLVTSREPARAFEVFSALPEVREIRMRGPTKETVILADGTQVDLRVVDPSSFGAALQYFTGSKEHNVIVRTLAREAGLRVNEYGVFRGETRIAGATEEEVYAALGLAWIPPELREGRDEIDRAKAGPLPPLVGADDLTEELHLHLDPDGGAAEVDRRIDAARRRGLRRLGVVTEGIDDAGRPFRLPEPMGRRLARGSSGPLRIRRLVELDAGAGAVVPPGTDGFLLRPSHRAPRPTDPVRGAPPPEAIVHVGSGDAAAARAWIDYAAAVGAAVEVGPGPDRIDPTWARSARLRGVPLLVPTGVGDGPDDPLGPIALAFARRAGATPGDVRNAGGRPPTAP